MNEELQGKMVEIVSQIQSGVKASGTFVLEQLPDVATQYIRYAMVSSLVFALMALAVIVFSAWVFKYSHDKITEQAGLDYYAREDRWALFAVLGGIAIVLVGIFFIVLVDRALFVTLAPKAWLLKELAGLIK